jgi:2-amino-4-hydroxy-6-hydroxymethyldihydropteridine diphosphokinase
MRPPRRPRQPRTVRRQPSALAADAGANRLRRIPRRNKSTMEQVYIGLGSNLADPRAQVERALQTLAALPRTALARRSRLYRSAPWGRADQPEFVNAVAALRTELSPRELLDALLAIERAAGRARDATRWGPRVLDLDILVFGDRVIDEPGLHVPHPHLHERAFVLLPLAEIAADMIVPGRGRADELAQRIDAAQCRPLEIDAGSHQ